SPDTRDKSPNCQGDRSEDSSSSPRAGRPDRQIKSLNKSNMTSRILSAAGSIQRRIFILLMGMSAGSILIVIAFLLPFAIKKIAQDQLEVQRVSVRLVRDQIQERFENVEGTLRVTAM